MRVLLLSIALIGATVCAESSIGGTGAAPSEEEGQTAIVRGNSRFALDLYSQLRRKSGNIFFSPYSISTALAMTYGGARGRTESQMAGVLHFTTVSGAVGQGSAAMDREDFHLWFGRMMKDLNARGRKGSYELRTANALWGQEGFGFLDEFVSLVEREYEGRLREVDFVKAAEKARAVINSWVEKKTNERIKDLIQPGFLDAMTRLVLTNAVYFKGNWERRFKEEDTKEAPFTLLSGEKVETMMMGQQAEFGYTETDGLQVIELPYVEKELSMLILLPRRTDGLGEMEESLTVDEVTKLTGRLRRREVEVFMPRFKMTSRFSLADVLKSMGVTDAFTSAADFSGMNGQRNLFISSVVHKAFVEVNEEGTEAAAATAVGIRLTSVMPGATPVFRADHPFVFMIRDNKFGAILFLGRVVNPAE